MTKQPDQIKAAASGHISEEILAAAFAKPRGATSAAIGGGAIVNEIGGRMMGKQTGGAAAAGIELGNPGALAVTPTSLVTMTVGVSAMGAIKSVKDVLSTVPLAAVDAIEVNRMGLAGVMTVTAGGTDFKLEGKVDDMRAVAEAFERARATG